MRCPQCMQEWDGQACRNCGHEQGEGGRVFAALPAGYLVRGRYRLGNALGESRQALVYLAWDEQAGQPVLVEEFYPKANATRQDNQQVVSRRQPQLFSQAADFFSRREGLGSKPNPLLDAFLSNGTAYRIYQPKQGQGFEAQAAALMNQPLLFRDAQGRVLMTINALPMPQLPAARPFQPSGSIARKRKRQQTRRLALGLAALVLVLAGALLALTLNKKVPARLELTLYPGQSIWLRSASMDALKVGDYESGSALPGDADQGRALVWEGTLNPGDYSASVRQEGQPELDLQAFQVARGQQEVVALSGPKPLMRAGDSAQDNPEAARAIKRLQELGYLDIQRTYPDFGQEAAAAFAQFAQERQVPYTEGQPLGQAHLEALDQAGDARPYLPLDGTAEPAREKAILDALTERHYLLEPSAAMDQAARAAWQEFLGTNGHSPVNPDSISVEEAALLFSAPPKPPSAVVGQPLNDKTSPVVRHLSALGLLGEDDKASPVFSLGILRAYQAFLQARGLEELKEADVQGETWLYGSFDPGLRALASAPTPSPVPPKLEEGGFVFRLGDAPTLYQVTAQGQGEAPEGLEVPPLRPVRLALGASEGSISSLVLVSKDSGLSLALKRAELYHAGSVLWLQEGLAFDARALVANSQNQQEHSFDSLVSPFVPGETIPAAGEAAATLTLELDDQAVNDYYTYAALPLREGSTGLVAQGELRLVPEPEADQIAALKRLFEAQGRVQVRQAGKASAPLRFYPLSWSGKDPFAALYRGEKPLLGSLAFTLEPALPEPLPLESLAQFQLPPGSYTLNLHSADAAVQALLPQMPLTIAESGLALSLPFQPEALRAHLGLFLVEQNGVPALQGKAGGLDAALISALLTANSTLTPVDLAGSLKAAGLEGAGGSLELARGSQTLAVNIGDTLLLEKGSYTLILGGLLSQPLEVGGTPDPVSFAFDAEKARAHLARLAAGLSPAYMVVANQDESRPRVVLPKGSGTAPAGELARMVFAEKKAAYKLITLVIIQAGWLDSCPVDSVRLSNLPEGAARTALDFPLLETSGQRLRLDIYLPADAAHPGLRLNPAGTGSPGIEAPRTFQILEEGRAEPYLLALVQYPALSGASIPEGTITEFFVRKGTVFAKEEKPLLLASGVLQEALNDPEGLSHWVLLPLMEIWLAPGELAETALAIHSDGTVIQPMGTPSPAPAETPQASTPAPQPARTPTPPPAPAGPSAKSTAPPTAVPVPPASTPEPAKSTSVPTAAPTPEPTRRPGRPRR